MIDAVLVFVVATAWLGCLGFARLRSALDRMHAVTFVNATSGAGLTIVAFLADGVSVRAVKILLVTGVCLLTGAAMSHAVGRALVQRGAAPDTDESGTRA